MITIICCAVVFAISLVYGTLKLALNLYTFEDFFVLLIPQVISSICAYIELSKIKNRSVKIDELASAFYLLNYISGYVESYTIINIRREARGYPKIPKYEMQNEIDKAIQSNADKIKRFSKVFGIKHKQLLDLWYNDRKTLRDFCNEKLKKLNLSDIEKISFESKIHVKTS